MDLRTQRISARILTSYSQNSAGDLLDMLNTELGLTIQTWYSRMSVPLERDI